MFNRYSIKRTLTFLYGAGLLALLFPGAVFGSIIVDQDAGQNLVTIKDETGQLSLRLNYGAGCRLDQVIIRGREVAARKGIYSGIRIGQEWFTSERGQAASVKRTKNSVTVSGIKFGKTGQEIEETWKFTALADRILWRITRKYPREVTLDDLAFPQWNFADISTWTGGLLDNGGVVWNKYLDRANATYGGHFETVTFWNAASNDCLRITPKLPNGLHGAGRFSRQADNSFLFNYTISENPAEPKHGLNRFVSDKQDLWKSLVVRRSEISVEFELKAFDYAQAYDRGNFVGLDGSNVRELFNTVARYGVIDSKLTGGNGWRSGYICLHEPFFAQIAMAVNAADYTANLSAFLDNVRDHAIGTNGRVKSRWTYGPWDAMPGSYDKYGFYEAQWGYLMDSQPDYVMNVVEQFHLTGDLKWLASHQTSCERALKFLMDREIGDTGLVAMMTDSHKQQRGSDWIDIIWASYKNAFINAQLYAALNLWAGAEESLGESKKAADYRAFATRLKASFNKPTSEDGFWDSANQWYVYWRDKDGTIHGNNLVTPVNFAAIAYGLCDDPARRKAILDRIEAEMKKENLFYWPLSFFPYEPEEGAGSNFPFPKYENGDIFLSWGELGVRAYASYDSALALKYVKKTLDRYAKDGLSFQRYLRSDQRGEGDDILAGNCMPIVGLYRDIYGIQPMPNQLQLDPHLPGELAGTTLRYELRGQLYTITLGTNSSSIAAGNYTVHAPNPFGVHVTGNDLQLFCGARPDWSISFQTAKNLELNIHCEGWSAAHPEWVESLSQADGKILHALKGLISDSNYELFVNGKSAGKFRTDKLGQGRFTLKLTAPSAYHIVLSPAN